MKYSQLVIAHVQHLYSVKHIYSPTKFHSYINQNVVANFLLSCLSISSSLLNLLPYAKNCQNLYRVYILFCHIKLTWDARVGTNYVLNQQLATCIIFHHQIQHLKFKILYNCRGCVSVQQQDLIQQICVSTYSTVTSYEPQKLVSLHGTQSHSQVIISCQLHMHNYTSWSYLHVSVSRYLNVMLQTALRFATTKTSQGDGNSLAVQTENLIMNRHADTRHTHR